MTKEKNTNENQQHTKKENTKKISIGSFLKTLREEHEITIEQLSKHLKIRVNNLIAIEKDQKLEHIPHAYYRGYVKNYCLYFGVNPSKILENNTQHYTPSTPQAVYNNNSTFQFSASESKLGNVRKKSSWISLLLFLSIIFVASLSFLKYSNSKMTQPLEDRQIQSMDFQG